MKIILIDKDNVLKKFHHGNFSVIKDLSEIDNPEGVAFLTDEFSGREYFNTNQQNPIKYQGERFDNFEFGVTLPQFNENISNIEDRVFDLFKKAMQLIADYNSKNTKKITTIVYDTDQLIIRSNEFNKYLDLFIKAYDEEFSFQ